VLDSIEKQKHYPRVARRRRLTGDVEVHFVLLPGGTVKDISTSGAHKVLRRAAEQAVQQASPFLTPPAGLSLPREVRYIMRFELI